MRKLLIFQLGLGVGLFLAGAGYVNRESSIFVAACCLLFTGAALLLEVASTETAKYSESHSAEAGPDPEQETEQLP